MNGEGRIACGILQTFVGRHLRVIVGTSILGLAVRHGELVRKMAYLVKPSAKMRTFMHQHRRLAIRPAVRVLSTDRDVMVGFWLRKAAHRGVREF